MLLRYTVLCAIFSFLLLGAYGVHGGELTELERQIEELHQELDASEDRLSETRREVMEEEEQLEQLREREGSLLQVVERYEAALEQTRRNIRWLRQQEEEAEQELEAIRQRQRELESRMEAQQTQLGKRLRAMYMQGQLSHHRMLLRADSPDDLLSRSRFFREILQHDQDLIHSFKEDYRQLEEEREKQQEVVEERRNLRERVEQTQREEQNLRDGYERILGQVEDEQEYHRRRIRELEEQQDDLQGVMDRLRAEQSETQRRLSELKNQFSARQGNLRWPVESRRVLRQFGAIQDEGVSYDNPGIDIAVSEGTPVHVVAEGTVIHIDSVRGRGQVVIVQHDEFHMTVYGSLIDVDVETNQQLESGDRIGHAGQSSGFDEPLVHFQVVEERTLHNPLEWLE